MASLFHGIQVEVISNNQTLHMYDDPDGADNDDPKKCQRYIEAITGATFSIKITLTPAYEQGPCDAVRVKVYFDDTPSSWYQDIMTTPRSSRHGHIPRVANFSHLSEYCNQTHQWKQGVLSFGKLDIKETSDTKKDLAQASKLGRIRVEAHRINHTSAVPKTPSRKCALNKVAEVSEKVLKGKAITNTVGLVDVIPSVSPAGYISCDPIKGDLGQITVIDILYRSRNTLKMIGCLPKTPDPEEELQTLRARISKLERGRGIKGERSNTPMSVKRERKSRGSIPSSRKRLRSSESPEIIELPRSRRKPVRVEEIDLTSD